MAIEAESSRQKIVQEVMNLPEKFLPDLLSYIRFLRFQTPADPQMDERFSRAVQTAREIGHAQGITEEIIAEEIAQVRRAS